MDNKSGDQLLIIQDTIEANRKDYDEKTKKITEYLTAMITSMMDYIKISKSSPDKKDSSKDQDPTTVVLAKKRAPSLESGHSEKLVECRLSNMRSAYQNSMKSGWY